MKHTDPATQLANFLDSIIKDANSSNITTFNKISQLYSVQPWSNDFYSMLIGLTNRIDHLICEINLSDEDNTLKAGSIAALNKVKNITEVNSLTNNWNNFVANNLDTSTLTAIRYTSLIVKNKLHTPILSSQDIEDLKNEILTVSKIIENQEVIEISFIKDSTLSSLKKFYFILERYDWFGWDNTIHSIRELIQIYSNIEVRYSNTPDIYASMYTGLGNLISTLSEKIGIAKDCWEKADFLLRFYGAVTLYSSINKPATQIVTQAASLLLGKE